MARTNRRSSNQEPSRATLLASCALLGLALVAAGCDQIEGPPAPHPPGEAATGEPTRTRSPKPSGGDATGIPATPVVSTVEPQSPSTAPEARTEADDTESVDPDAVTALHRMGEYLRTLRSFEVSSTSDTDEVLEDGQRIQISSTATMHVQRPTSLSAEVTTDRDERRYYYDGHTFTIESPRQGYYATVEAPGTLGDLVEVAGDRYGIDLPMVDLFLWGTDQDDTGEFTSAIDLGPSTIGRVETEHYAFRQEGLDWQIWIAQGDRPLPRMVVLTTTDEEARPSHRAVYTWDLHAEQDATAFTFRPRASSHRIELEDQLARAEELHARTGADADEDADADAAEDAE